MTLQSGARFGSYEIVGPLGAGGMGEVYRARDPRLDRHVALKVLPHEVATDAERLARFEREARILAAVNHGNIAQVYGVEEDRANGNVCTAIVMELVDGDDLSAIIARGALAVPEALAIARQIAEALETAHEQGIIHRDLKPGNVKVRVDGTVKLLDFGLAKAVESAASSPSAANSPTITTPAMTHAGVVLGTAAYMAPEQAKGKTVDRRADIWAFGAVLYEMLTGARAFPGDDVTDAVVAIMSREPNWSALPTETPLSVRALLKRTLDKDAKRRLRDIGEARLIIDDAINGRPGDEVPSPLHVREVPVWRRAIPAAAAAVIVGAIGFAAWSAKPSASTPVVRFSMTMPGDFQFTRASSRMLDISRDGSQIVYIGDRQLYLRSLSSGESRAIAGTVGADPATPIFSPDGQWIAFLSVAERAVKKVAVSGGASVKLFSMPAEIGVFQGGAWNGDVIYFAQQGKGIMRVSANGGQPEVVAPVDANQSVFGPSFLPGGRTFLMAITNATTAERWELAEIVAYTSSTRERKTVLRGGTAPRFLPTGQLVYASAGTLLSVPFDPARLEVIGAPFPVVENVRRVFDFASGAAQFAIADAGTIAYIPGLAFNPRAATLVVGPVDDGSKMQPLPVVVGEYASPRISPDGRQLAVTLADGGGVAVWVGSLDPPSPLRRLTSGSRGRGARWSRDSKFVIFSADTPEAGIYKQLADGSAPAERLLTGRGNIVPEGELLDGVTLMFSEGAEGDLFTLKAGSKPQPLVARPGSQRNLTFSPDGRYFAYTSREQGQGDIFVEPFPPNGAVIPLSTGGGGGPRWSPTGTDIFYQLSATDAQGASAKLMRLPVRTTPTFSIAGSPVEVPNIQIAAAPFANFDLTPDGKRVVFAPAVRAATPQSRQTAEQIHVVVNWFAELKSKAPAR